MSTRRQELFVAFAVMMKDIALLGFFPYCLPKTAELAHTIHFYGRLSIRFVSSESSTFWIGTF